MEKDLEVTSITVDPNNLHSDIVFNGYSLVEVNLKAKIKVENDCDNGLADFSLLFNHPSEKRLQVNIKMNESDMRRFCRILEKTYEVGNFEG